MLQNPQINQLGATMQGAPWPHVQSVRLNQRSAWKMLRGPRKFGDLATAQHNTLSVGNES